jgi:hypothetical protein
MAGNPSGGSTPARTLLEELLWREDHTYEEMAHKFEQTALGLGERTTISARHLRRLAAGQRSGTTPATRRVLQALFGRSADELLAAPAPADTQDRSPAPSSPAAEPPPAATFGLSRSMLNQAAHRAHGFTLAASVSNLTGEAMDQLHDDVALLSVTYQQQPLNELVGQLVELQDTLFTLLEGRQPVAYTRGLLLLAGVTSGLLAKISHDLRDSQLALTLSRTAFVCADNADHNGIRAWIRGLQSLITYWAGRPYDAVRYAQQGATYKSGNTSAVWLPASEARAWAALGNADEARAAVHRAQDARARVRPDEVDELGGLCTFSLTREKYYVADALAWLPDDARAAEEYAGAAVSAYADTTAEGWAFSDSAGASTDLAIARIRQGRLDGAVEAIAPVLALPPEKRINGILTGMRWTHTAFGVVGKGSPLAREAQDRIETFLAEPAAANGTPSLRR